MHLLVVCHRWEVCWGDPSPVHPRMFGGLGFDLHLSLFLKMLVSVLLKSCTHALMKLLVRVFGRWQLHNAGNDQRFPVSVPESSNQIAVHISDELQRYPLGAYRFAFAMVRAASEEFISHRGHHAQRPLVALWLTLR